MEFFRKKILAVYDTLLKAVEHEIRLYARFNVKDNPAFFNHANQLSNGFSARCGPFSENHREALRQASLGKKASL